MRVTQGLLITLLAALAGLTATAGAPRGGDETHGLRPAPTSCPTVTVRCPETGVPGQAVTFTANISGGDPAVTPTFKWTLPGFRILSGQGTASITVESPTQGGQIVATVVVKGYDPACSITSNCTTYFIYDPGPDRVGEYGDIKFEKAKARLDDFAVALKNDPTAQGYLVCYGGRRSRAGEARRRCDRAKDYTSTLLHHIDGRLVTVDGGFREQPAVELWVVPSGVTPPPATPTVDPKDVRPPRKARGHARR